MDVLDFIKSLVPYVVPVILGYLAYNHKRHDKTEKDILVLQTQMSAIKEDITEIRKGIEKLIDKL